MDLASIAAAALAPNWADKLGAWAEFATALIAVAAVCVAAYELRQSRQSTRETRASSYLERYGELGRVASIAKTNAFISIDGTTAGARIVEWEAMALQAKLEIVYPLNFWEELAGMYNRNLVDQAIVREYFGSAALDYWAFIGWFVAYNRGVDNPKVFNQLEMMCDDIRRRRKKGR